MIISIISTPAAIGTTKERPPSRRHQDLMVHKSLCAQILSKNSSPGRNFCPKPKENRWKQAEVLAWGGQGSPSPQAQCPGCKGRSLLGLLIITMVSATHSSSCAQSSWVAHGGLKHRETDPECPEENPQSTPSVFPNNCASADFSRAPKVSGTSI